MRKTTAKILQSLSACSLACVWSRDYPSPEAAWNTCHRGDWLLWVSARLDVNHKKITEAACACAKQALLLIHSEDIICKNAIECAERWACAPASSGGMLGTLAASHAAAATRAAFERAAAIDYRTDKCRIQYALVYATRAAAAAANTVANARAAPDTAIAAYYATSDVVADSQQAAARDKSLSDSAIVVRSIIQWQDVEIALAQYKKSR